MDEMKSSLGLSRERVEVMEVKGPFALLIRKSEVMRYLGYRPGVTEISPRVEAVIDEALNRAGTFLKPRAAVAGVRIDSTDAEQVCAGSSSGGDTFVWRSKSLARLLNGCPRATIMAVTIGPELENESSASFARGEYTLGAIYDAAGSEAVEGLADEVNARIDREARAAGYETTPRFSPGYGRWALADQAALLALVGTAGIKLTPALMLDPQKSVTAVVGWRPLPADARGVEGAWAPQEGDPDRTTEKCLSCDMDDCRFRREGS